MKKIFLFNLLSICFLTGQINIDSVDTNLKQIKLDLENFENRLSKVDSILNFRIYQFEKNIEILNSLNKALLGVKEKNKIFEEHVSGLDYKFDALSDSLLSTTNSINGLYKEIKQANSKITSLGNLIANVSKDGDRQIQTLDKTISDRSLYWIITILIIFILIVTVFFSLKSKVTEQGDSLSSVKSKQNKLDNEVIQLNSKLMTILEQQLDIANLQQQHTKETDHSLPIKLGEEIHRMRKRLKTMDDSQGTKVLKKRLESLEERINEMGYEIVNLEGKSYSDGMTIHAQFVHDENLNKGEEIIKRVIKPQINFNGMLIKAAEVEVSQGV